MDIEIWGKNFCPYCEESKILLEEAGLEYRYRLLGEDFTAEEAREEFPRSSTYPKILMDGHWVGGYTELVKILSPDE
jgi:glutaredoxin